LRVSVYQDGRCVVTAPSFLGAGAVERFVAAKSAWIADKLRAFMPFREIVTWPRANKRAARALYSQHKEAARALVTERLAHFNQFYGFRYNRIAIRNQKSRWGSCSARGNVNFNYRIALLPARLSDYVIVLELCHIGRLDHSQAFWDLVARAIPDWKERRAELRKVIH
jgi:predicted metal-dependent hydrolase